MAENTSGLTVAMQESTASSRRLSIVVAAERVERTRGRVAEQIARGARLPGFRKGKLPTRVIEQRFGPSIDQDTIDRTEQLRRFQVDDALMSLAQPGAVFMHCLPAHRGDEMTASVIDGPQSVVWDEAENRLHAQQGILLWCLGVI